MTDLREAALAVLDTLQTKDGDPIPAALKALGRLAQAVLDDDIGANVMVMTVEIWPGGDVHQRQIIGSMEVINVTKGAIEREDGSASYRAWIDGEQIKGRPIQHDRNDGPWQLIANVLRRALP